MAVTHKGSWFGLPDFGITEKIGQALGRPSNAQGGSNIVGAYAAPNIQTVGKAYQPPPVKTIQGSYQPSGGGGGGGSQNNQQQSGFAYNPQIQSPSDPFGGGGPSEMDMINDEFNQFNSYLDTQAGTAQSNFDETKGLYDTMKTNAETQYGTEKKTQIEGAKKTEALNLSKVRQLLADLSQKNAARTSITGGGSVSEALGERFGRQAQSSLGNVIESTKQSIERVSQFYDNAITKLNETYNSNILQAKQALQDNLSQIQAARVQSASAKQRATIDAWRDYYNNVNQSKLQAANFKAQYDMWYQQQQSALGATQGFNQSNMSQYGQDLSRSYNNFQQTPGVQQTQAQAINPYYRTGPNPDEEKDPFMSPSFLSNSTIG